MKNIPFLSIVIPTYNYEDGLKSLFDNLEQIPSSVEHEIIFVDDASSDHTYELLAEQSKKHSFWQAERLDSNSGSAAAPRNHGLDLAKGEYVFFLDADDLIVGSNLEYLVNFAKKYSFEVIRTPILVREGNGEEKVVDRIPKWDTFKQYSDRVRAILSNQSLTCSFLIRRTVLDRTGTKFDATRRIGEDIVFTSELLAQAKSVGYQNRPLRLYVKRTIGTESVTQKLTSVHFLDFLLSWEDSERLLSPLGVSFVQLRGNAAIQYAFRQFLWFRTEELDKEVFTRFSAYLTRNWAIIEKFKFSGRIRELISYVITSDYQGFINACRLRLVVAGHDLKFMDRIMNYLSNDYEIRVDKWSGHNTHDEKFSREILRWGDLIWCEWLLGSAVWYSRNSLADQRLVIRAHRSELVVDYGAELDLQKVRRIIGIAPHCIGDFSDRFDIPRELFSFIPNAYDTDGYDVGKAVDRMFNLAIVGIVPRLKRFDRAVDLLASLRDRDTRYNLTVYGKKHSELEWLMRDPLELAYFEALETDVRERNLTEAINYVGWANLKTDLANVGICLSLSDYEGSHVSPAEIFCAGGVALYYNWRGADTLYPREFVFDNMADLESEILALQDPSYFASQSNLGRQFLRESYSESIVFPIISATLKGVRA